MACSSGGASLSARHDKVRWSAVQRGEEIPCSMHSGGGMAVSRDTKLDREIPTPGLIVPVHRFAFTGRR
jgi:hypothetical protein